VITQRVSRRRLLAWGLGGDAAVLAAGATAQASAPPRIAGLGISNAFVAKAPSR